MPLYDTAHGGHYGASANIAAQGHQPPPETFTGQWANVGYAPIWGGGVGFVADERE